MKWINFGNERIFASRFGEIVKARCGARFYGPTKLKNYDPVFN